MECKDEAAVERQKLVPDDGEVEIEDDQTTITNIQSAPKSIQTPISPVLSSKVSSGETSRTQDSSNCSVGKGTSEQSAATSTRLMYVNETRKALDASKIIDNNKTKQRKVQREIDSSTNLNALQSQHDITVGSNSFEDRSLKHHSFLSEIPDVRHMEKALLGLLEDFHSGKLKAFASGCTMEQMTDIREQQERLAKLHFELGAGGDPQNSNSDLNVQENMSQLVQKLEMLSVSIERLHSSNVA